MTSTSSKILNLLLGFVTAEGREIRRLKNAPRYKLGETKLMRSQFEFADARSFVWQYLEINKRRIYEFKAAKNPFIIDCGANVGVSVLYFARTFPAAEIIAFEPDSEIFEILKRNVERGGLKNVQLVNKGLWNKSAQINFEKEGADGGRILEKSAEDVSQVERKITKIEVVSLRPYLEKDVQFLKLDIEGAESIVLEDCADLLKNVENIFVEFHSTENQEQELDKILTIIKQAGFKYFIESATIFNEQPFISRASINNFDNLLNIYGYR